MNVLVIDTASSLEIIAACAKRGGAMSSALPQTSHSVTILPAIDRCLSRLGITPGDLDLIGVGVGPGSFTGIRIAVSTARMLAQVLGRPLVGLPTHLIYAVSISAEEGDAILVAFDAKKGRVFGALYRKTGDGTVPREIIPPGDYSIEHLASGSEAARTTHCIGNGTEKYARELSAMLPRAVTPDIHPDAGTICALAVDTYRKDPGRYGDYNNVVPDYARKSDAEEALDRKNKAGPTASAG
ncbi:MAG: tRNA (adenosine(37)-N6)-threonylcarbamoyltransferase complex dimerization subunit type 1 TsaB [Spirochaetes bacterium]|nr:tRNA (adenosine(37)-N6)-threonylcarbamoyltransferase complex dimerization subunit type 1 TsaB [Spirochaetota bacterium]